MRSSYFDLFPNVNLTRNFEILKIDAKKNYILQDWYSRLQIHGTSFCSIENSCHKFITTEHTLHYYSPLVHTIQTLPCLPIVNNWHVKITGLIYESDFQILHQLMKPQRNTYFCIGSTNETIKKNS
ncbi:hypothetical protein ACB094_09G104100 [Castanea mollissima]